MSFTADVKNAANLKILKIAGVISVETGAMNKTASSRMNNGLTPFTDLLNKKHLQKEAGIISGAGRMFTGLLGGLGGAVAGGGAMAASGWNRTSKALADSNAGLGRRLLARAVQFPTDLVRGGLAGGTLGGRLGWEAGIGPFVGTAQGALSGLRSGIEGGMGLRDSVVNSLKGGMIGGLAGTGAPVISNMLTASPLPAAKPSFLRRAALPVAAVGLGSALAGSAVYNAHNANVERERRRINSMQGGYYR